jgi:Insect cuticle protein
MCNRYSGGPSAKTEIKTLDGVTRGSYSYVDAESKLQTVQYVSDALGFRVAATNLPVAPVETNAAPVDAAQPPKQVEETPEVMAARAEHLAAIAKAKAESSEPELPQAPEPVEDTEEVKQAREEHLQAVEEAKTRSQEAPAAPAVVAVHALPAAVHLAAPVPVLLKAGPGFAYAVVSP